MKSKSICSNTELTDKQINRAIDVVDGFGTKHSVWSIFEVVSKMDAVAFKGENLKLVYLVHWGPKPVEIELPPNPTWKNLMNAADAVIELSGDTHHVFVEDFHDIGDNTLELVTGS